MTKLNNNDIAILRRCGSGDWFALGSRGIASAQARRLVRLGFLERRLTSPDVSALYEYRITDYGMRSRYVQPNSIKNN